MSSDPCQKDEELQDALRRRGAGEITAIRIANVTADDTEAPTCVPFEQRARKGRAKDLYARAKALGIVGRSSMTREQLISALREA